jgi:hypothetical protein
MNPMGEFLRCKFTKNHFEYQTSRKESVEGRWLKVEGGWKMQLFYV